MLISSLTANGKYMQADRKRDCLNIIIEIRDILNHALNERTHLTEDEIDLLTGIKETVVTVQSRMYAKPTKNQVLEGSKYGGRYPIQGTKEDFERLNKVIIGIQNIVDFGHKDDMIFLSKACEVLHDLFAIELNDSEKKRSEASKVAAITVKHNRTLIAYKNSKTLDEFKAQLTILNSRKRDKEMSR
jgi:hypothetical protein